MNIHIYYGGRGVIEDPALYVLKRMETVLDELHVKYTRYNLYDTKTNITTLPQTLKEADGIILAASMEWIGIGGYLQQFLDACWLYGDKEKISSLYMCPVVISTTYGEKDAYMHLIKAWELLGGKICDGICAYVEDSIDFESNESYGLLIEKKAENIYRTISKKITDFPSSIYSLKENYIKNVLELTPQEGEQLSMYVSDDIYVQKQKEDIEELASFFKDIMNQQKNSDDELIDALTKHYIHKKGTHGIYSLILEDDDHELTISIMNSGLTVTYEAHPSPDLILKTTHPVMERIINGRTTFQKAFMTGEIVSKGSFQMIRLLDECFDFSS